MTIVTEYDFETNTMTYHTPRETFRQTVALVAEKAKAKLPTQVNGRVESAVKLVLAYDVQPQADGSIEVGSASDPLKVYRLVGSTCECQDFTRGQAPEGWCQHRIAAGIQRRVQEVLPQSPPVETEPAPERTAAVPTDIAPLPEAPASANCHITIAGRQIQLTLRDTDEARLLERLSAVLAQSPVPAPASSQAPTQGQGKDWCPVHQVAMKENEKHGRRWFSHWLENGTWCKGK